MGSPAAGCGTRRSARYEFSYEGRLLRDQLQGRLAPDVEPEQPRLWDNGLQAWESTHDPAEGL